MEFKEGKMLDALKKYDNQDNGIIGLYARFIIESQGLYESFLDEIRDIFEIENFGPPDVLYALNKYSEDVGNFNCLFPLDSALNKLESTIMAMGFNFQELGVAVFSERQVEDMGIFNHVSIPIFFWSDKSRKQFGSCKRAQIIGIFSIDLNLYKDGIEAYRILFHEMGHAIHYKHISKNIYRRSQENTNPILNEALAQLFEVLVYDHEWLTPQLSIEKKTARLIRRNRAVNELFLLRATILHFLYELLISSGPDLGLKSNIFWESLSRTILFPRTEDILHPSNSDYYKIIFHSFASKDKILSIFLREQIRSFITKANGAFYCDVKKDLLRFYEPGGSMDFRDLVKKVTGEEIKIQYIINYLRDSIYG